MCARSLHYGSRFWYFYTSGISWGCDSGVSSLIVPIFIFDIFLFLGATAEILLGWNILLMGSSIGVSLGMPYQLEKSEVLHG